MRQAGNREGLILDPVYSAKALAGLFALTRNRIIAAGHTALFLATGGTPGLFAYHDMLRDYIPGDFRAD